MNKKEEIRFCKQRIEEQKDYLLKLKEKNISLERFIELAISAEKVRIRFEKKLKYLMNRK